MAGYVVGIDPGKGGALALLSLDLREARVWDCPADYLSVSELWTEIRAGHQVVAAAIEQVGAFRVAGRTQGGTSMFSFGQNFGVWLGLLAGSAVPHTTVRPQRWQASLLDGASGDPKERSLLMARRLFPFLDLHRKKDHGKADALHLARWAAREFGGSRRVGAA